MQPNEVIRAEKLYEKDYRIRIVEDFTKRLKELFDNKEQLKTLREYRQALSNPTRTLNEMQLQYLLDTVRKRFGYLNLFDFGEIQKILIEKGVDSELDNEIVNRKEFIENFRNIMIGLDKDCICRGTVTDIKRIVELLNAKGMIIRVAIDSTSKNQSNSSNINYLYGRKKTKMLLDLYNYLIDVGCEELVVGEFIEIKKLEDFEKTWTIRQVIEANNQVDKMVNLIKHVELSPFEAMLFIHKAATWFEYKKPTDEFVESGRVLPSIFKDEKIVCSGYASFVKAVIDKLNLENVLDGTLVCEVVGCTLQEKGDNGKIIEESAHCHNLIRIEDDKYGIKGVYVEDACWDCAKPKRKNMEEGRGFAHCLYPVADLLNFTDKVYRQKFNKKRVYNLLYARRRNKFENQRLESIVQEIESLHIPDVVWKNILNSKPIDIDVYRRGLKNVIRKTTDEGLEYAKKEAEAEIEKSISMAKKSFSDKSKNTFYIGDKR